MPPRSQAVRVRRQVGRALATATLVLGAITASASGASAATTPVGRATRACQAPAGPQAARSVPHASARMRRLATLIATRRRALRRDRGHSLGRDRAVIRRARRRLAHLSHLNACAALHRRTADRLAAANASAALKTAPAGLVVGINSDTQGWGGQMAARQTAVGQSGVRWLREQFNWDVIEPAAGQWAWSNYDQLELQAAQHGMTILPLLMRAPNWAQPTPYGMPTDPTAYGDFVAHVVSRYGPGGTFWTAHPSLASFAPQWFELWNEAYYPQFANNDVDPAAYARLVRAAGQAGKSANAQAKFLIQANDVAQLGASGSGNWVDWTDALYQAVPDLNKYYDGVAVHPYSKHYGPAEPSDGYIHDKFARIADIHSDLIAHGANTKAMWITEMGWSTCSDTTICVSPATQAAYTQQLFALMHSTYTYVGALFLYRYDDLGTPNSSDPEADFGLIQQDGTPKPVWNILKTQTATS